ncbi:hypothetical protein HYZ82_01990 [Candidatus Nomurabacteria bacterium]|nr:hypothetical protein [Candidatus Nomurabacteria bacterium]
MNVDKTENERSQIIERALESLGMEGAKTDPLIIKDVLMEMQLHDFQIEFQPLRDFINKALTEPQPFAPLIEDIKQALVKKHPAVVEFVELALETKWLQPSVHIRRAAHVAYILEALTATACDNHKFFLALEKHMRVKQLERGLSKQRIVSSLIRITRISHKIFCACKAAGVDPLIAYFRLSRGLPGASISKKKLSGLYANHKINYLEYRLLLPTPKKHMLHFLEYININIYEAGITEYEQGFKDNAVCAYELSRNIEEKQPRTYFDGSCFLNMNVTQEWCSLYVIWNMAFVLSELEELDLIFPKLLIPSLLNVKPERFIGTRLISLWLAMNFDFFREVDGRIHVTSPENRKKMAEAWGKINKKYAFALAKREVHESSREVLEHYKREFSHPFINFIKRLVNF